MKAANFLKQTFPLALGLNHLNHLRESLYLLSIVNGGLAQISTNKTDLQQASELENLRDRAASLFLHTD